MTWRVDFHKHTDKANKDISDEYLQNEYGFFFFFTFPKVDFKHVYCNALVNLDDVFSE